jgi:hypothetical protein
MTRSSGSALAKRFEEFPTKFAKGMQETSIKFAQAPWAARTRAILGVPRVRGWSFGAVVAGGQHDRLISAGLFGELLVIVCLLFVCSVAV